VHDLKRNLDQFRTLSLPKQLQEQITITNALKVFPIQ
jgi:hypothetical protein